MLTVADTAYAIAAIRAEESAQPEGARLFHDPWAAMFHAAGAHAEEGTQRFLSLPAFRELIRLRTRFIDEVVRDGLAAGVRQVVLLGAGFDTRGMRLPEVEATGAAVFEVDFPAQLDRKRGVLSANGVAVPARIRYVGCDFGAPEFDRALAADLEAQGFRSGQGAIFVWEGVIAYIDAAAIDRTLAFAARVGGPGSRIVFEYMEMALDRAQIEARARGAGFTRFEETPFAGIWRRCFETEPHPNAEVCRMGVAYV